MANAAVNRGIRNSWSLLSFARAHGKMQVGQFTNGKSGDKFSSCIFTDAEGSQCFVAFSSNLGVLTPQQIAAQKDKLRVVELEPDENGVTHYSLCRQGENNWQDVDLF